MPRTILICTDGSPRAEAALRAGLDVLAAADRVVIASVVEPLDPGLVVGTGMAGGVMTPSEALVMQSGVQDHGQDAVDRLRTDLGIPDAELQVLTGSPGAAICDLATELGASVIVIGSRGRGGFRRAVLGSVSDHVVRHAPVPGGGHHDPRRGRLTPVESNCERRVRFSARWAHTSAGSTRRSDGQPGSGSGIAMSKRRMPSSMRSFKRSSTAMRA